MAADIRSGKRERAEAYALQAADAARRGDHRAAARLYQAAFLELEGNEESLPVITDSSVPDAEANDRAEAAWLVALLGDDARRGGGTPPEDGGGEPGT